MFPASSVVHQLFLYLRTTVTGPGDHSSHLIELESVRDRERSQMHKPYLTWSAAVLVSFAVACRFAARDGSSAKRVADTLLPASTTASERPSDAASSVGGEALAVCDTVANMWRALQGADVTRADSTFYAFQAGDSVSACHVSMVAPAGLSVAAWHASYWGDSLSIGSVGRGWTDLLHWDGDGPGALSRTLMRNGVRCHVSYESDPGSDDDSTYVPSQRETQATSCWFGPATLTPRDTGGAQ